jgi:Phospholipase_D-nuclease N-terminal/Short C-terminal domain
VIVDFFGSLWDLIVWMLVFFVWIGALFALFYVITDLFRDRSLGTGAKVVWFIVLLLLPWLGALIYLIARGKGMAERSAEQARHTQELQERYIRNVAGPGATPAEQIERAKGLLDSGAITQDEYAALKAKALA